MQLCLIKGLTNCVKMMSLISPFGRFIIVICRIGFAPSPQIAAARCYSLAADSLASRLRHKVPLNMLAD
nr:MAG TPA: hypothetical protein [Caudoviricetes sp.]